MVFLQINYLLKKRVVCICSAAGRDSRTGIKKLCNGNCSMSLFSATRLTTRSCTMGPLDKKVEDVLSEFLF